MGMVCLGKSAVFRYVFSLVLPSCFYFSRFSFKTGGGGCLSWPVSRDTGHHFPFDVLKYSNKRTQFSTFLFFFCSFLKSVLSISKIGVSDRLDIDGNQKT